MGKKIFIQIFIIFLIFFIISIVYMYYFKGSNLKPNIEGAKNEEINLTKESEDLITEMFYFSEDNKGNRYEIKSKYGVINPNKSNLIIMDKVTAEIFLLNGEKIFISSNKAEYNDNNNDTTFSGSVRMFYKDHKISSEKMDLSFENQTAILYNKVNYRSSISDLSADKFFLDFLNKKSKIQMIDENKNVLVRSTINNGNN